MHKIVSAGGLGTASHQVVVDDEVGDAVGAEEPGPAEGGAQLVKAAGDEQQRQVADKHLHPLPLAAPAQGPARGQLGGQVARSVAAETTLAAFRSRHCEARAQQAASLQGAQSNGT